MSRNQQLESILKENQTMADELEGNLLNIVVHLVEERDLLKQQQAELIAKNTELQRNNIRLVAQLLEKQKFSEKLEFQDKNSIQHDSPIIAAVESIATGNNSPSSLQTPRNSTPSELVRKSIEELLANLEANREEPSIVDKLFAVYDV